MALFGRWIRRPAATVDGGDSDPLSAANAENGPAKARDEPQHFSATAIARACLERCCRPLGRGRSDQGQMVHLSGAGPGGLMDYPDGSGSLCDRNTEIKTWKIEPGAIHGNDETDADTAHSEQRPWLSRG